MVDKLTEEQIAEYRDIFDHMDKNKDGSISTDELWAALKQAGLELEEEEVAGLMKELDLNNDGNMDFSEFLAVIARKYKEVDTEEELREVFMVFDRDNKGTITSGEIKYVMNCLNVEFTNEEVDELVVTNDRDGDGMLSFEEFMTVMLARDPPKN